MIFGSRSRGLCQLNKIGVYFTQEKQEAIFRGDTSGSVVNRHFVDVVQAFGMHLCGPGEAPTVVRLQARHLQKAWESLIQLTQTNQEKDKAQALMLHAHGFIILRLNKSSQLYFLKACKTIEKAKLRFLPEHEFPIEFSDQVREEASVLSQTIYLENYRYLALGGPAPVKTTGLEREFRSDLQVRNSRDFFTEGFETDLMVLASVPLSLRDMPFGHADSKYSVGQRCGPCYGPCWT